MVGGINYVGEEEHYNPFDYRYPSPYGFEKEGRQPADAMFSDDEVREIRKLGETDLTFAEIADKFDCHRSTIGKIVNRKSYKHVE